MSINKNHANPLMQVVTNDALLPRLRIRLPRFLRWLAPTRKENSQPVKATTFELGHERFSEGGYYQVSPEQIARERAIDILSVNLPGPFIR